MTGSVNSLSQLAAAVPVLAYIFIIWRLDRYEREPLWLIGMTFLWGALGGTCFGCLLSVPPAAMLEAALGQQWGDVGTAVVVAPFVEEFTKGIVFLPLLFSKNFDNETDGLITLTPDWTFGPEI